MHVNSAIAAIVLLAAGSAAAQTSSRSGWYLAGGAGAGGISDLDQEGRNRDMICYPDAACFDEIPVPAVPGYRWRYDIALHSGAAFELSVGRYFESTRLELTAASQSNDTRATFTGIAYLDGAAIEPRIGGAVASNGVGTIDRRRVRSVSLDAYYDFPAAWGAFTPYVGAGIGHASVDIAGVRFSADYWDASATPGVHDPPFSVYKTVQDTDLDGTALVWRLHTGADYAFGPRTSLGLRLTWSETGDFEDTGTYEVHRMHGIDPDFTNTNAFSDARRWTLTLALRRGVGD